jgi:hypothetical protein
MQNHLLAHTVPALHVPRLEHWLVVGLQNKHMCVCDTSTQPTRGAAEVVKACLVVGGDHIHSEGASGRRAGFKTAHTAVVRERAPCNPCKGCLLRQRNHTLKKHSQSVYVEKSR